MTGTGWFLLAPLGPHIAGSLAVPGVSFQARSQWQEVRTASKTIHAKEQTAEWGTSRSVERPAAGRFDIEHCDNELTLKI